MASNIQAGIGVRLRTLRESKGLTQKDLGDLLGITPAAYGKLESGDRGLSSEYCIALADFFGVSCDYILRGVESEFADICTKTYLSPEAVNFLVQDRAMIEGEKAKKAKFSGSNMCAEYMPAIGYDVRYYILNALLSDPDFCFDIGRAGLKLSGGLNVLALMQQQLNSIDKLYEITAEEARCLQERSELVWEIEQIEDSLDSAEYRATRAFMRFLKKLYDDAGFLALMDVDDTSSIFTENSRG